MTRMMVVVADLVAAGCGRLGNSHVGTVTVTVTVSGDLDPQLPRLSRWAVRGSAISILSPGKASLSLSLLCVLCME